MTSAAGITIIISIIDRCSVRHTGRSVRTPQCCCYRRYVGIAGGRPLTGFGVMNIVNFAHGEFFMVGTLVAYFSFTPLSKFLKANPSPILAAIAPFLGIFAAIVIGILMGIVIELLVFKQLRKRNKEQWVMNSFLLTVGISVVIINGTQLIWGADFKGIVRYWEIKPDGIIRCDDIGRPDCYFLPGDGNHGFFLVFFETYCNWKGNPCRFSR
jgi:branched-chain amino acid transport system permease protein